MRTPLLTKRSKAKQNKSKAKKKNKFVVCLYRASIPRNSTIDATACTCGHEHTHTQKKGELAAGGHTQKKKKKKKPEARQILPAPLQMLRVLDEVRLVPALPSTTPARSLTDGLPSQPRRPQGMSQRRDSPPQPAASSPSGGHAAQCGAPPPEGLTGSPSEAPFATLFLYFRL